jgi:hypothetical protein
MGTPTDAVNPLGLSDDDFLKQLPPGSTPVEPEQKVQEVAVVETPAAVEAAAPAAQPQHNAAEAEVVVESDADKVNLNADNAQVNTEVGQEGKTDTATASTAPAAATAAAKDGAQKTDPAATGKDSAAAASTATAVDYEGFYKQVMAPFKANGKTIELRDPQEAIQLMQMGANYTRKMQDIQPHRKTLLMLENSGLLDPDKLSFLIDVNNGDSKAIQKLLKDKGVDPLSIDTSEESNYLGGNHKVSDDEANFRNVLDDLSSNPDGKLTLQAVNSTWDQASKEVLWKEPQILTAIHQQRENGIYDRITAEVNRLQALGQIPVGTSFLSAYKAVGDVMQQQGKFNDLVKPAQGSAQTVHTHTPVTPVATRVATPKSDVSNGDQASAAAASRSTPGKAEKFVNPLSLSDDDFLKQMKNRV